MGRAPAVTPPTAGGLCSVGTPHRFVWNSTGATSGTLTIGNQSRDVTVDDRTHDACGSSGQVATLTITGPGGTDSATTVLP